MAILTELLRKQEKRLAGKEKAQKERVRITRKGPTRPWQESLEQYQPEPTFEQQQKNDVIAQNVEMSVQTEPLEPLITGDNNRGQTTQQRGTTGDNNGGQQRSNRGQTTQQRGTTGDNNGGQQRSNRGQTTQQRGTTGDNNGGQQRSNRGQTTQQRGTTIPRPPLAPPLSTVEQASEGNQAPAVPRFLHPCPPLQPGTDATPNQGQFPTAPQELSLLFCLVQEMQQTGLGTTRVLKNDDLADMAKIKRASFKKIRARVLASGHCHRQKVGEGRSKTAGCIYVVSAEAITEFNANGGQQENSTGDKAGGQSDSSNRSLSLKEITTKGQARAELIRAFDELIVDIEVDSKFKVDGTDLVDWWFKVTKEHGMNLEEFKLSFERWIFKLSASPIKAEVVPKGLLAKRVLSGVCGLPEGFVSLQDRRDNALRDMRKNQLKSARQKQLDQYNDEFELWFTEADDTKLLEFVSEADGSRCRVKPEPGKRLNRGPMLKALVKEEYAASKGIDIVHWGHLAEQLNS